MPPQPPGIWKSTYSGEKWKTQRDLIAIAELLYTYKKRTSPYPAMTTLIPAAGEVWPDSTHSDQYTFASFGHLE